MIFGKEQVIVHLIKSQVFVIFNKGFVIKIIKKLSTNEKIKVIMVNN